jgi:3-phenylpropionate/trans-cinnamate dioxygenase ferredoxin component
MRDQPSETMPPSGSATTPSRATTWVEVCSADEVEPEDVIRFDHEGHTYAIYRSADDTFHATDGRCTHERAQLADGLVMGDTIECPKHNGRFNYKTGEAKRRPACVDLRTYPVLVRGGRIWVRV